jgi:hypothetical protein
LGSIFNTSRYSPIAASVGPRASSASDNAAIHARTNESHLQPSSLLPRQAASPEGRYNELTMFCFETISTFDRTMQKRFEAPQG